MNQRIILPHDPRFDARLDVDKGTWEFTVGKITYLIPIIALAHDEQISEMIGLREPKNIRLRGIRLGTWLMSQFEMREKLTDHIFNRITEFKAYIK